MSLSRSKIKRSAIAFLSLTLCASFTASCATVNLPDKGVNGSGSTNSSGLTITDVTDEYDTRNLSIENFNSSVLKNTQPQYETRTVIVNLDGDCVLDIMPENANAAEFVQSTAGQAAMRNIDREQKTFLSKLRSQKIEYELVYSYKTVTNSVAIEVDTSYVKRIKDFGGVASASIARTYLAPQVEEGSSDGSAVVNDAYVYETGIYNSTAVADAVWGGKGEGMTVAVLDTGLDYSHEAFQKAPPAETLKMDKAYVAERLANTVAASKMAEKGTSFTLDDAFVSDKVPFAFDYADIDADVYPSYSNHGTHVAGIVAGQADSYVDKDGNVPMEDGKPIPFKGVAPEAQLLIFKTFTDNLDDPALGGAEAESIMAALEDCVIMGVDVINMSLGSTAGFTTTDDGDDEGEIFNGIFKSIQDAGINLICAASNDYSAGFGSVYGTNLASNPDSGTVGSPSTYFTALSVASISGQKSQYLLSEDGDAIFFDNASNGAGTDYDFVKEFFEKNFPGENIGEEGKAVTFVYVGTGEAYEYTDSVKAIINNSEKQPVIVLATRGGKTFQEKVTIAANNKAAGFILFNNVSGTIKMSIGDIEKDKRIPAISITKDAGEKLRTLAASGKNTVIVSTRSAGPFMSEFSSWGTTNDLRIKPEITAHGGEITSSVRGGYAEQSGTSMAAPNMAGLTALVRNYVSKKLTSIVGTGDGKSVAVTQLSNQLMMSTATIARDKNNLPYSPRKQGAGLANLGNIVSSKAYLFTDSDTKYYYDEKDGRPKVELGEDEKKTGVYEFNFKIKNFDTQNLVFTPQAQFMTETLAYDKVTVQEQAYLLNRIAPEFTMNGASVNGKITVNAGETAVIGVKLRLHEEEKRYIEQSFSNGMFVEGFITLVAEEDSAQCDLNLPFMGFYGDWEAAPMLDYTAFEIAQFKQDSSFTDETRPKETVWATQPFATYNEDNYVIPMGSYLYTTDPSDTPMYANMEYCAISRFNEIVSEEGIGNYATTYNIRCVYAGLLRNAQQVDYKLYDSYTGEVITTGVEYRISKAYASGGSARPAYLELKLNPEELGLVSNGKYTFEFEFKFHKDGIDYGSSLTEEQREKNKFTFDFYVDYEAPTLQDARIRYYDYTENDVAKQRIYLDLDVFDNHYPQSVMLCYLDTESELRELKLINDYVTPIRNPNKNGTTTVSIEVTDIWEEYKGTLALQIDDYALNHTTYMLAGLSQGSNIDQSFNASSLPDDFDLAPGEENITLDINEMHKVGLVYEGDANISNFEWKATSSRYFAVKNGEIVGLASTNGRAYPVTVSNYKGVTKRINVTVTDTVAPKADVTYSFGNIKNKNEAIVKATGTVEVYAGRDYPLTVEANPWYYSTDGIDVVWSSGNSEIATVDQNGKVHTKKRGTVTITAKLSTGDTIAVNLMVNDEFTVSNMSLTRYRGEGADYTNPNTGVLEHNVVIVPSDKAIISIGEDAFKDNTSIRKIIIPKTVTEIAKNAFKGCTALEEVYFMTDEDPETGDYVHDSDINVINRNAFEGCTGLKLLDLRYTKVFTVGKEAFKDCVNLSEIRYSQAIGTVNDRAFMGCSSLKEFNGSGLLSAGENVFSGCTSLNSFITDEFTAIGANTFAALDYYYNEYNLSNGEWDIKLTRYGACDSLENVVIKSSLIGSGAFSGLKGLKSVTFDGTEELRIGDSAFENCPNLATISYENNATVKSFGARTFANCTSLVNFKLPNGLESVGAGAFENTGFNPSSRALTPSDDVVIENGAIYSQDKKVLIHYSGTAQSFAVPATVEKIGSYAFANSSVTSVTLPASLKEIGEGAFSGSNLNTIVWNGTVTEIAPYTFSNTKLTSVTLPNTITFVGDSAFADCRDLTEFTYAPQAENVGFGSSVFSGCISLENISLDKKITTIGDTTFFGCVELKTAVMPAVTSLGSYTFFNTPALTTVTFDADATVTGEYTFAAHGVDYAVENFPANRPNLTSVTLGNSLKEIGAGAFFNCTGLSSVNLNGATVVGDYAFYGANRLSTVTGLDSVVTVGNYAFANCNFSTLELSAAKSIGDLAFISENSRSYTAINIPVVQTVGERAFYGNNATQVNIPASAQSIGGGAFGASQIKQFTVDPANTVFFVNDGVLYRNVGDKGYFALTAFPSAKAISEYRVIDNTAKIDARAFQGQRGKINKIILPFELKEIGVMAFFQSGITVYEFMGVTAPVLQEEHSEYVDSVRETAEFPNRGYYYANFQDYLIHYLGYGVTTRPAILTLNRPENATGYDTPVWSAYFATGNLTGIAMQENTHDFVVAVNSFPSAEEISLWSRDSQSQHYKTDKYVWDFSEKVKAAHENYNAFSRDPAQLALVDESLITKFNQVETALRAQKPVFNIYVSVSRLDYTGDVKTQYKVGETFDMSGLQVIIVYDDYSTEYADMSKVTVISPTRPLNELDRTVTLALEGVTNRVRILIEVTKQDEGDKPEPEGGCAGCEGSLASGLTTVSLLAVLGVAIVVITFVRKKHGDRK